METISVEIPEGFKVNKAELKKSVRDFVRLKLSRDLMLERLNKLLKSSNLTEKECLELGRAMKQGRFDKLKQSGLV